MKEIKFDEYIFSLKEEMVDFINEEFYLNDIKDFYIEEDIKTGFIYLKCYVESGKEKDYIKKILEEYSLEMLSKKAVTEQEWLKPWIDSLKPFEFIKNVWINPFPEKPFIIEDLVINLIPGAAFGTGLHQTTKLAAFNLSKYDLKDKSVIDIGCGTGILAIYSKLKGANKVLAIDYDSIAIEKCLETCELNNVNIETFQSDFLDNVNIEIFDFIVSNIVADILIDLVNHEKFFKIIDEKSIIIFSGINKGKEEKMEKFLFSKGLKVLEKEEEGEWISLILQKNL